MSESRTRVWEIRGWFLLTLLALTAHERAWLLTAPLLLATATAWWCAWHEWFLDREEWRAEVDRMFRPPPGVSR